MQDRKWFLLNESANLDSRVEGPFSKDEVDQKILVNSQVLIWGRGQSDWAPYSRWTHLLTEFEESSRRNRQQAERLWRIQIAGQEMTPMPQDQMMEYLKNQTDLSHILLWTEGYDTWKEIYQIHKIMDELGVSRRAHPRVPIMGTLLCEGANAQFEGRVLSISEGGLGVTDTPPVKIGEKFKTTLKSPNLYTQIHATAEVVYVGSDGYAGLKFIGLHSESKGAIIEYVKKFQDAKINPLQDMVRAKP